MTDSLRSASTNRSRLASLAQTRVLLFLAVFAALPLLAAVPATAQNLPKAEAGVDFNFVRSNAPPAQCGCFSAFGGSGEFAWNFTPRWAAVGQVGAVHTGNAAGTGQDLMLTSYLAGGRYSHAKEPARFVPYGQILMGASHAGGGLSPSKQVFGGSSVAFAATAGGGLDFYMKRNVAIRLFEADYFVTTFSNEADDHQNNLRISAGVLFRFGPQ